MTIEDLKNQTLNINRREMIRLTAGAAGGTLLPGTARVAAANPLAGALLFLGGLVVGEIVLGVLRGYDIDIGGNVEDIVRNFRNNDHKRRISANGSNRLRYISDLGRTRSGVIQVNSAGIVAAPQAPRIQREPEGIWVPGALFWVATKENIVEPKESDLRACGCGYPVSVCKTRTTPRKNPTFSTTRQEFEGGHAKVVIDLREQPIRDQVVITTHGAQKIVVEWEWRTA